MWLGRALLLSLAMIAPAIACPAMPRPVVTPASAPASSARWIALEGRIESAYFQQDTTALQALAASLAPPERTAAGAQTTDTELQDYYGALLAYRLALLTKSDTARAWPFTQQCVDRLNRALVMDSGSAEALALQSACLALQSRLDPWRSPLAGPLSRLRIDKALELAPDNPRVLLLGALAARDRPRLFGGDVQQAFGLMQRAVSAFERQRGEPRGLPGWGAADAFTDLAQDYLTRGDALAARNVLERALLIAPDFAQARTLMAEIVSG